MLSFTKITMILICGGFMSLAQSQASQTIENEPLSKTITGKHTVYKWKDSKGKIFYTDMAPPVLPNNTETKQVTQGNSPTINVTNTPTTQNQPKKTTTNNNSTEITNSEDFEKERQRQCQRAKLNLTTLSAGGRIQLVDEQGLKISLDETGVQKERGFAEQAVSSWCQNK